MDSDAEVVAGEEPVTAADATAESSGSAMGDGASGGGGGEVAKMALLSLRASVTASIVGSDSRDGGGASASSAVITVKFVSLL